MLDKYSDSQKMFYDYFNVSNNAGHVSHAYLIETCGVSYSFNLALDLAKFLLCDGVYDERICNLIDNGNYPNLKIIGNNGAVKKVDIVTLKSDFSMKSTDNKRQVYILCDVQDLNKNAILVEVGGVDNDIEEVNNTMKVLSETIFNYIRGEIHEKEEL